MIESESVDASTSTRKRKKDPETRKEWDLSIPLLPHMSEASP
jgi:hypothetical protein